MTQDQPEMQWSPSVLNMLATRVSLLIALSNSVTWHCFLIKYILCVFHIWHYYSMWVFYIIIHSFLGCKSTNVFMQRQLHKTCKPVNSLKRCLWTVLRCHLQNAHLQTHGPEDLAVCTCFWPSMSPRHRNRSSPPHREGLPPRNYASLEPPLYFLRWRPIKKTDKFICLIEFSPESQALMCRKKKCNIEFSPLKIMLKVLPLTHYCQAKLISHSTCFTCHTYLNVIHWLSCFAVVSFKKKCWFTATAPCEEQELLNSIVPCKI